MSSSSVFYLRFLCRKCALLETSRQCHYRMRLGDQENQWHCISQICRNRVRIFVLSSPSRFSWCLKLQITAVCDFLNYLRYVERGLVKSSGAKMKWKLTFELDLMGNIFCSSSGRLSGTDEITKGDGLGQIGLDAAVFLRTRDLVFDVLCPWMSLLDSLTFQLFAN